MYGKDILQICKDTEELSTNLFKIDLDEDNFILYNSQINKLIPSDEFTLQDVVKFIEEHIAIEREDGKWTFINTKGQQICDWYNYIEDFYNGFARVRREDGKWSFINTKGQQIGGWHKRVTYFQYGVARVQREDDMVSLINTDGKQICDWYKDITGPAYRLFKVQRNDDMVSLINTDGKQICDWYSPNTKFRIVSPNEIYDYNSNKLIPLYNENHIRLNNLIAEALHASIRDYLLYN